MIDKNVLIEDEVEIGVQVFLHKNKNKKEIPDTYVLAAFNVDEEKSVMYRKYVTLKGLARGVTYAMDSLKADYISLRRIQPKRVIE